MRYLNARRLIYLLGLAILSLGMALPENEFHQAPTAFHIKRSRDASQIVYKIRTDQHGNLDLEEPIAAFWVRYKTDGRVEPITFIQKEFSYGLKFQSIENQKARFHIAAYPDQMLYLRKVCGEYRVYTSVDDEIVELDYIYVHFEGGTDWLPTVKYVNLYTHHLANNEPITKTILP